MKTLYLDCSMGAAGDMLTAALLELVDDKEKMLGKFNTIGLHNVSTRALPKVTCGIQGTYIDVSIHKEDSVHGHSHGRHDHTHHAAHTHAALSDILNIIQGLHIPEEARSNAGKVYQLLAEAEAHVHGGSTDTVHFHEVGMLDAVADIVNVCLLLHEIKPDAILVSPINTGCGQTECAHGLLPVPAPATACLLQELPVYHNGIRQELCTPTGAALLKFFATPCAAMPPLTLKKIGYGVGKKDLSAANCVRALLGETAEEEEILELSCNLDDMTPEDIGYARDVLLEHGALDAYTIPLGMKKGRPGVMLNCLCKSGDKAVLLQQIFTHTTTLGIRELRYQRYKLKYYQEIIRTPLGEVSIKKASGYGVKRSKPEYEDIKKIAQEKNLPLAEIRKTIQEN